ncbi:MAG: class 1 fructose-bisphosphatase [Nitrospirae bacterium]|nr:MAG: class 1 fructose-bisphosphatase [Nitrospirota bacterium]
MAEAISLTRHILQQQRLHAQATGEFSAIMAQIALAGKMIARDLSHAGLIDILGSTGEVNVQGEEVQKLDQKANETFVKVFEYSPVVKTLISEEMEEPVTIAHAERTGKYALFFDPLDGSSNIDVNAPLGSIFSIHRLDEREVSTPQAALLKRGSEQVAAGYLLYGASTVLVYTCGDGVHQFTLDPGIGEFLLSATKLQMPARGKIYSTNEGNRQKWLEPVQRFVNYLQETDAATGRPYSSRYTGCLVADVHRILLKGGLYLYPGEVKKPEGKLRLMYEAAPLSFVVEQAGGLGSTGVERINTIQPKAPHQRVPLVIGSRDDVTLLEQFMKGAV